MGLSKMTLPRYPRLGSQPSVTFLSLLFLCISIAVVGLHAWQIRQVTDYDSTLWKMQHLDKDKMGATFRELWQPFNLRAPRVAITPHLLAVCAGSLNIISIFLMSGIIWHFSPRASVCMDCNRQDYWKTSHNSWIKGTILVLWVASCLLAAAAYMKILSYHLAGAQMTDLELWAVEIAQPTSNSTVSYWRHGHVHSLEQWSCGLVQYALSGPIQLAKEDYNRGWATCLVGLTGRYALSLLCGCLVPIPLMAWFTLRRLPAWRQSFPSSTG